MGTLIACASKGKKELNQDYCTKFKNTNVGISGVIVADGIGSHFKSEIGSKFCSDKLKELIEGLIDISELSFNKLFNEVKLSLIKFAKETEELDFNTIDKNQSLGTTLICVVEHVDRYDFAYVGNGSIWHIAGHFNRFSKSRYLPWNSINLLNPHSVEQEGKEALYRYFSVSDKPCNPTILTLEKDKHNTGEIIMITTDGIFSNDQVPVAKDDNNTIWIRGEETMPILYSHLDNFLKENPVDAKNEDLEFELNKYLGLLKEKSILHDDSTIGILISERTIEFHQKQFEKKSEVKKEGEDNSNQ